MGTLRSALPFVVVSVSADIETLIRSTPLSKVHVASPQSSDLATPKPRKDGESYCCPKPSSRNPECDLDLFDVRGRRGASCLAWVASANHPATSPDASFRRQHAAAT